MAILLLALARALDTYQVSIVSARGGECNIRYVACAVFWYAGSCLPGRFGISRIACVVKAIRRYRGLHAITGTAAAGIEEVLSASQTAIGIDGGIAGLIPNYFGDVA